MEKFIILQHQQKVDKNSQESINRYHWWITAGKRFKFENYQVLLMVQDVFETALVHFVSDFIRLADKLSTVILPVPFLGWGSVFRKVCYNQNSESEV